MVRRKKKFKPQRLPKKLPKKVVVTRRRTTTYIDNRNMRPLQTFPRSRRDEYELSGAFRISRRPTATLIVPRRRGWASQRRNIMLRFNVIMSMTTYDFEGDPLDVTFQKSFFVAHVNTSYVQSRNQAKKIIKQIEAQAKKEFPKAKILGTYLVEIIVGKRTNDSNVFGGATVNSDHKPRKLFPRKNLRDIT